MSAEHRGRSEPNILQDKRYRDLLQKNLVRLFLTYLFPLIVLTIYFHIQYRATGRESRNLHLKSIAEYQANTLDLFLWERVVNLANLIDDPRAEFPPSTGATQRLLMHLKKNSDAFIDIGYFDSSGVQIAYAGPLPFLERQNYSAQEWFVKLHSAPTEYIITDIYLGLRHEPHFTIAVCRWKSSEYHVLRASLDPKKLYEYITSFEGTREVDISIVNQAGFYQLVTPHVGTLLESSSIIPPRAPTFGVQTVDIERTRLSYAYTWLKRADWAVIVQWNPEYAPPVFSAVQAKILGISLAVILIIFGVIIIRAWHLVLAQQEKDRVERQLEHAAKLAAIGELAAGIAHEINNPLAIISEEVGLMKDLTDPQFGRTLDLNEIMPRLDTIQEAVFCCRDITRKLLFFVRKAPIKPERHDVNTLIDEVVVGLLGAEMRVSNIEIIRDYQPDLPPIMTDRHQFQQVLLNLLNNAVDAIEGRGSIMVSTSLEQNKLEITVTDTGKGMTREQLDKIFLPFYTTKEVGKGTGLGLSVSYEIIKGMGGTISVESKPVKGSEFTIRLPFK